MNKKFIVFSSGWDGMPIAYHLQHEGYDVTVGQIQDKSELENGDSKEDKDEKIQRLSQYDGMLKKYPAKDLVEALKSMQNKDDYFVFFDQNSMWKYSEELLSAGFKNGLFPTKDDFDFEKSRDDSMEFVSKNYPEVKIIPHYEFSKVDDAKKFMSENQDVYVLQSMGDLVSTIVPTSDVPELATEQISNQLDANKKDYEKGGILLKRKLINPIEITPQIVFYNGKPVYTSIDIETKNIGDGLNNGPQTGCGSNLIISTEMNEKINKIAFPPIVYEMAKKHTGMFVWDISLYIMKDGIFFGEFCPNRVGYDASMTEMCMSDGAGKYFKAVMDGKNPLKDKFGVAVRLFNLKKTPDISIQCDCIEDYTWLFNVKEVDLKMVSVGADWELGVITASDDSIEDAVNKLFDYKDKFVFKEVYSRTKADFLDYYPTSILHRFSMINHKFIEARDTAEVHGIREELQKEYDSRLEKEVSVIKDTILAKKE